LGKLSTIVSCEAQVTLLMRAVSARVHLPCGGPRLLRKSSSLRMGAHYRYSGLDYIISFE